MELHSTELTRGLNIVTIVKVLRTTAMVMHILLETIEKRIYKSARRALEHSGRCRPLPSNWNGVNLPLEHSAYLALECDHILVCITGIVTPGRRRHVQRRLWNGAIQEELTQQAR